MAWKDEQDALDLEKRTNVAAQRIKSAGHWITDDNRVTADGAAYLIGIKPKTLRNWRSERKGPPPLQRGRLITYHLHDVLNWISTHQAYAWEPIN